MAGIYKITNLITNQSYIGQSIDIERRWTEHKTPKAKGNDRLHKDIQRFGINNFKFEILKECKPSELLIEEQMFIKKQNPFYNTVGKKVSETTRKKISESCKEWWENLPDAKKKQIISENLKGQPKGHTVSDETKRKISVKISEIQKQKVICKETGEVFESIGSFEKSVGASTGTCAAYWKGKIKSVKGFHVEKV